MAGQTVVVSVLADTKKFSRALSKLGDETGLTKLKDGFVALGKAAALGGAAVVAGAALFGKAAIDAASQLQQSIGGVDAVFKENSATVHAWAKSAAKDLGLSENSYNELATVIGSQLKNMGVPMEQVTGKTSDLITKGADLAAQFGGSTSDAVSALSSLMRGETDPIERYGVSIKEADIKARMAADGTDKLEGAQAKQARTQAILSLLNEQTADSQGKFASESDTLAGQQQRLAAQFENVKATLGTYLLPIMTKVTGYLSDNLQPAFESLIGWVKTKGIPAFQELAAWFQANVLPALQNIWAVIQTKVLPALQKVGAWLIGTLVPALVSFGQWIVKNKDWLTALAITVGTIVLGIQAYIKVMAIWKTIQTAAIALQAIWNAVLAANPIGLIILAIAALVAGLVYFFTQTETGKAIWASFSAALATGWEAIKAAFKVGYEAVKSFLGAVWDYIKLVWNWSPYGLIINNWSKIMDFFGSIPGKVRSFFDSAWNVIKTIWNYSPYGLIINNWNSILGFFGSIPGRILGFFGSMGSLLYGVGQDLIQGLVNGIGSAVGRVAAAAKNIVSNISAPVRKLLGINSPSRVFKEIGNYTVQGLVQGLGNTRSIETAMRDVSGAVTNGYSPSFSTSGSGSASSAAAGGNANHIEINFNGLVTDPVRTGQEVQKALDAYFRANGRRA